MKYINYDFRKTHFHDYSTQPTTYDSATINHIPDILKVKAAKEWMGKAGDDMHSKIVEHEVTSDWTFSSPYKGSIGVYGEILHSCESLASPVVDHKPCQEYQLTATEEKIPVERLTPQNPILHFEDIIFYEDELDDFGRVEVRLRFRVMEDCAFGLFRCYLRYRRVTQERQRADPLAGHEDIHRLRERLCAARVLGEGRHLRGDRVERLHVLFAVQQQREPGGHHPALPDPQEDRQRPRVDGQKGSITERVIFWRSS